MEKSNVYSLMTRLKNQSHLRVPATAEKPQKARLQPPVIQVTPSVLKRAQTPAVLKMGQVTAEVTRQVPVPLQEPTRQAAVATVAKGVSSEAEQTDPALIALQDDFKELAELHHRLHFMLKDLESILESEKQS